MYKLPALTSQKVIRILERKGFILDRTKGSHRIYYHSESKRRVVIPFHKKDLPKGTLINPKGRIPRACPWISTIKKGIKITTLIQSSFDLSDYQTKEREIKSLIRASKELNYPHLLIIISNEEGEEIIKDKKIKYIPIWKWLLNSK